jgi:hypothetical protein
MLRFFAVPFFALRNNPFKNMLCTTFLAGHTRNKCFCGQNKINSDCISKVSGYTVYNT